MGGGVKYVLGPPHFRKSAIFLSIGSLNYLDLNQELDSEIM